MSGHVQGSGIPCPISSPSDEDPNGFMPLFLAAFFGIFWAGAAGFSPHSAAFGRPVDGARSDCGGSRALGGNARPNPAGRVPDRHCGAQRLFRDACSPPRAGGGMHRRGTMDNLGMWGGAPVPKPGAQPSPICARHIHRGNNSFQNHCIEVLSKENYVLNSARTRATSKGELEQCSSHPVPQGSGKIGGVS